MKTYKELLSEMSLSTRDQKHILHSTDEKNGKRGLVIKRDIDGMPKPQDKFIMVIVDKNMTVIKGWGTHPSLKGAINFITRKL